MGTRMLLAIWLAVVAVVLSGLMRTQWPVAPANSMTLAVGVAAQERLFLSLMALALVGECADLHAPFAGWIDAGCLGGAYASTPHPSDPTGAIDAGLLGRGQRVRSMMRSPTKGPRSVMRTTDRLVVGEVGDDGRCEPMGRVRCAAVMAFWS